MNSFVITGSFWAPPFCQKEILRYAGCKTADSQVLRLMEECMEEAKSKLSYRVCYRKLSVSVQGDDSCFGAFSFSSASLAETIRGCKEAVFFAATVGSELDRLIGGYGRLSPAKALMLQAIGAERIEALCDLFCAWLTEEEKTFLTPRFSPGYGDLKLDTQKEIFSVLECEKRIGVVLNHSLLMSPSKSVTAIVGLGKESKKAKNKCSSCPLQNCSFRGAL